MSDGRIKVFNYAYYWPWSFTACWISIEGTAFCDSSQGKCNVEFFKEASSDGARNYQVIDTDYDNYSLVYYCGDYLGGLFYRD